MITKHRPIVQKTILALAVATGLSSFAGTAMAAIVYNSNPNFVQNGNYFSTYNMLGNPSPYGAGFYLIQSAAQQAQNYGGYGGGYDPYGPGYGGGYDPYGPGYGGGYSTPAQPASSRLSAFSNSFFEFSTLGEVIDASPSTPNQLALSNGEQYVGFNLIDQLNNNSVYYGWMSVTVSGVNTMDNVQFALNAYAYDDSGSSIKVGQTSAAQNSAVPEPSTYALFGMGALALFARRRKVA